MLNKTEYLLNLIQEECCEVAQRASKCIRFGIHEAREGKPQNIKLLAEEILDLLTVITLFDNHVSGEFGDQFTEEEAIEYENSKIEKIEKYHNYSKDLGLAHE